MSNSSKLTEQGKKFVEAAKSVGASENPADFDSALRKLSATQRTKSPQKRKTKKPTK